MQRLGLRRGAVGLQRRQYEAIVRRLALADLRAGGWVRTLARGVMRQRKVSGGLDQSNVIYSAT